MIKRMVVVVVVFISGVSYIPQNGRMVVVVKGRARYKHHLLLSYIFNYIIDVSLTHFFL